MFIPFTQGIVSHTLPTFLQVSGNKVSIIVTDTPLIYTIAQGNTNYLVIFNQDVPSAWEVLIGPDQWIYLDVSQNNASYTYGKTFVQPTFGPSAPASPVLDQHWFDTFNRVMNVWTAPGRWVRKIRVFTCMMAGGSLPISMGDQAPPMFTGTQVGLLDGQFSGQIVYDPNTSLPVKKKDTSFVTTEDRLSTLGVIGDSVKLAAIIVTAEAQQNLAAYTVVKFSDFGRIVYADAFTVGQGIVYGVIQNVALVGDVTQVTVDGLIENPAWDWTSIGVNAPLYSDATGQIVTAPVIPNQSPIGFVVARTQILLSPPRVENITINNVTIPLATNATHGVVRLATSASNPADPIAVGDNDPRLTDDRNPLPHTHIVANITDFTVGVTNILNISSVDVLADVVVTAPIVGQALVWDGLNWTNQNVLAVLPPIFKADIVDFVETDYVHIDGTETIIGDKTFTGSFTVNASSADVVINSVFGAVDLQSGGVSRLSISTSGELAVSGSIGSPGQFLTSQGAGTPPTWTTVLISTSLNDLTDVTITAPVINNVLQYNGSEWVNGVLNLSQLGDVTLAGLAANDVLLYNGIAWSNSILNLNSLSDVVITAPVPGDVLTYNGVNWIEAAPSGGVVEPANQIVYGTGVGVDSEADFTWDPTTDTMMLGGIGDIGTITNGDGGSVEFDSGILTLTGFNGDFIEIGASINITGFSSATPSPITIQAGDHTAGGAGANVSVTSGAGITGGQVTITSGFGSGLAGVAGNLVLQGGSGGGGSGFGGNVIITAGTAATDGEIRLETDDASIRFTTNATERFEITATGEWEVGGGVGSSGEVLTSNGAGVPPTWQAASGVAEPLNQIVYGTGPSIDSSSEFIFDPVTAELQLIPTTLRSAAGGTYIIAPSSTAGINGSAMYIAAGAAGTGIADGGRTDLLGGFGNGTATSTGGLVYIQGGGNGPLGTAGSVSLRGGAGSGAATGGNAEVYAGGSGTGQAGTVNIIGGNGPSNALSGDIVFTTGFLFTERFKIARDGEWSLATDPGTAGEVITSNGAGAAPTWQTPTSSDPNTTTKTNAEVVTIVAGAPVYISSAGNVLRGDASAAVSSEVLGLNTADVLAAGIATIRLSGKLVLTTGQWDAVTGGSGGLTENSVYYLDTATGMLTTTVGGFTTGDSIVRIGRAIDSTTLFINIMPAILL